MVSTAFITVLFPALEYTHVVSVHLRVAALMVLFTDVCACVYIAFKACCMAYIVRDCGYWKAM